MGQPSDCDVMVDGAAHRVNVARASRFGESFRLDPGDVTAVQMACAALPPAQGNYLEDDFLVNLVATVVDFQLQTTAVEKALAHFERSVRPDLQCIDDLRALFDRWPATREGNTELARHLFGYRLWTRAQMLRDLVSYFDGVGVRTQDDLRAWARRTSFEQFKGRVRGLGPAVFQWLVMRQGVDTVKPDVHVHRFVENAIGRRVGDAEAVALVTAAARLLGRDVMGLDWAIWEAGRGAPRPLEAPRTVPAQSAQRIVAPLLGADSGEHAVLSILDNDAAYVTWLTNNADGYVLNSDRTPKASYLVLHSARCGSLWSRDQDRPKGAGWTTTYRKTCSTDARTLVTWAQGLAGSPTICGMCKPGVSAGCD